MSWVAVGPTCWINQHREWACGRIFWASFGKFEHLISLMWTCGPLQLLLSLCVSKWVCALIYSPAHTEWSWEQVKSPQYQLNASFQEALPRRYEINLRNSLSLNTKSDQSKILESTYSSKVWAFCFVQFLLLPNSSEESALWVFFFITPQPHSCELLTETLVLLNKCEVTQDARNRRSHHSGHSKNHLPALLHFELYKCPEGDFWDA